MHGAFRQYLDPLESGPPMKEAELLARLNSVIGRWIRIPSVRGYGGTGAPGRVLEELLGVRTGNLDIPDAGQWELKFLSGTSLLTLFHLEAEPKGHLHNLIRRCSWPDLNGRASFRHTVRRPRYGHSRYGLHIESEDAPRRVSAFPYEDDDDYFEQQARADAAIDTLCDELTSDARGCMADYVGECLSPEAIVELDGSAEGLGPGEDEDGRW